MSCLLVAVVTLLISTLLYINFENAIINQNAFFIQGNLEKASNSAVFMSDWARTVAIQTLYDNDIIKMTSYDAVDPQNIVRVRNRIISIRQSSPNISSIYIYNGKTKLLYSDTGNKFSYTRDTFFDKDILPYLDSKTSEYHLKPIPRLMKVALNGNLSISTEVYTFLLYENPSMRRPTDNAIVLNVSRQWLDNAVRSLDKSTADNFIIVNSSSHVVYGGTVLPILTDLSADPAIAAVNNKTEASGYFISGSGESRQLVTWLRGTGKESDWIYIYRLPADSLTRDVSAVQQATVLFSLLMLMLGLAGSVLYALYVYRPIHSMQDRLSGLEKERQGRRLAQRQEFLRSVLLRENADLAELESAAAAQGLPAVAAQPVDVILLSIDGFRKYEHSNPFQKREEQRACILGLMAEGVATKESCFAVDMEDGLFALLRCADTSGESAPELARALQAKLFSGLDLSFSAVIGASCSNWYNLSDAWAMLRSALSQRIFMGRGCVIDATALRPAYSGYEYPATQEHQMYQMLMLRHTDEALALCREILRATEGYRGNLFQITLLRITSAIMETADKLNADSSAQISWDFESFVSRVTQCEYLEEIMAEFAQMFSTLLRQINFGRKQNQKEIIDRVVQAIAAHHADFGLTIDSFGDITGLSGIHLSRLFSRYIGESFSDYLRKYRLDKARQMIVTSQESMQHIAEKAGFSNTNHFFTLFKKEYGLTPAEYRMRQKANKDQAAHV